MLFDRRRLSLEWRLWRREPMPWLLAALFIVAAAYAVANGLAWTAARQRAIVLADAENQRQFAELRTGAAALAHSGRTPRPFDVPASPGLVALFSPRYAALAPAPLTVLSIGESDVMPSYFRVTSERRDSFMDAEEIDNPVNLLNGHLDLAFVVVTLLPLLALVVAHTIVSVDRENGSLRLILAQAVSLRTHVAHRLAVRGLLLLGLVCAAVGAGVLASGAAPDARLVAGIGAVSLAATASIVAWLAVGAVISTRGPSSAANAVGVMVIWLVATNVIPTAINLIARWRYPVPPRMSLIERTRALDSEVRLHVVELLDAYYDAHPGEKPSGLNTAQYNFPLYWTAIQAEVDRRMAPILEEYDTALARQQSFVTRWAWLSPALVMQELMNDAAGTGVVRFQQFIAQVSAFHAEHRRFFEPRTFRLAFLAADDYDRMPRFAFQEEPVAALMRRLGVDLLAMMGWAVAALAFARRVLDRPTL
jgi:ABC-2 type transport system permease protein